MEGFPSILFKVHWRRAQATWVRETHPKPQHAKCFQWMQPLNAQYQLVACAIEAWACNVNQGIHGMPQTDCQRAEGIEKRKMLTGQNWLNRERVTTDEHFPRVHRGHRYPCLRTACQANTIPRSDLGTRKGQKSSKVVRHWKKIGIAVLRTGTHIAHKEVWPSLGLATGLCA